MSGAETLQALLDSSWARAGAAARAAWSAPSRMTAAEVGRFLARERYCAIATGSPKGEPHLVPVSFVFLDDGSFWLPAVDGSARLRDISAHPRAALLVGQGVGADHQLVIARGPVEIMATATLPAVVRKRSQEKLGDTTWAGSWLVLRPDRLIAYAAAAAG
jgi:hypothetical protein